MTLMLSVIATFYSLSVTDVLIFTVGALVAIGQWKRQSTLADEQFGKMWKETAEERGARIVVLEGKLAELERKVAVLEARPNVDGVAESVNRMSQMVEALNMVMLENRKIYHDESRAIVRALERVAKNGDDH